MRVCECACECARAVLPTRFVSLPFLNFLFPPRLLLPFHHLVVLSASFRSQYPPIRFLCPPTHFLLSPVRLFFITHPLSYISCFFFHFVCLIFSSIISSSRVRLYLLCVFFRILLAFILLASHVHREAFVCFLFCHVPLSCSVRPFFTCSSLFVSSLVSFIIYFTCILPVYLFALLFNSSFSLSFVVFPRKLLFFYPLFTLVHSLFLFL